MSNLEAYQDFADYMANAALQPIGRQAQALEIARVAVFLASEESSFMTGSIVTVDGGCTATFNHGN
jgi:NAD(P)-dependent dehydrogenase (short-subunit alcohol dehydrogenase family)